MIISSLIRINDDSKEIQGTIRNLGTGCQAYFADWNQYPNNLDDIVPDYIFSYRNSWSTGPLVYYTAVDTQYFSIWEGNFRVVDAITGKFVMDDGNFSFKNEKDFESFINELPA